MRLVRRFISPHVSVFLVFCVVMHSQRLSTKTRLKRGVSAAFCFSGMSWLCVFLLVFTSPRRTATHFSHACTLTFFTQIFSQSEPGLKAPCRLQVFSLAFFRNDLCASPTLNDGASSTALCDPAEECSMASIVTGCRTEAALQEGRASSDVGTARELKIHTQCVVRSYGVQQLEGSRNVQDGRSHPAALPAASSVCRGSVATTKEPRREFFQRLLPDPRSEPRRHRCFNVGTCELTRSSHTEP